MRDHGRDRRTRRATRIGGFLLALALLAAGCGVDGAGSPSADGSADDAATSGASSATGAASSSGSAAGGQTPSDCGAEEWDQAVCHALADVSTFWARTFPEVFGAPYQPITGGFFPYTSTSATPPCGDPPPSYREIADNAFYCPQGDLVAWDDEGLIPKLYQGFGPLVVAFVFAHEWGHAIQARADLLGGPTILAENQADCFAGAWTKDAQDGGSPEFAVQPKQLDTALAGFLTFADAPGTAARNPQAHGSAFDRVNGFQDGYDNGASRCAQYQQDPPTFTEMPFLSQSDAAQGGNAPFEGLEDAVIAEQESYWSQEFPQLFHGNWTPISKRIPYDPQEGGPACGGERFPEYQDLIFYCQPDDFIAWDEEHLLPTVYQRIGDFAVAGLFANVYAQVAIERAGAESSDVDEQQAVDCLTGVWARAVFDRTVDGGGAMDQLILSPGDLDEGVAALLAFGDRTLPTLRGQERATSGFERVDHFRTGFDQGAAPCV